MTSRRESEFLDMDDEDEDEEHEEQSEDDNAPLKTQV